MRVSCIFNLYTDYKLEISIIILIAKIISIYIFLYINTYMKDRFGDIKKFFQFEIYINIT